MEKSMMSQTIEKVSNQHIPTDLAFSILSKLSPKSLKRFGCVQKSWAHLFENPYFMSLYRNNFLSNNHSYYDDTCRVLLQQTPDRDNSVLHLLSGERLENRVKLDYPPPFQEDKRGILMLGSVVNGTLCLYQEDVRIILWNPTTEEFKVIPPSPLESPPPYDPPPYEYVMLKLHGFGYDHVKDDYKVIRHISYVQNLTDYDGVDLPDDVPHDPLWEIYSLRSNSWRKLDVDMPEGWPSLIGAHVYLNGACHWWGERETHEDELHLVSFDLSNEAFLTTPIPSEMDGSLDFRFVMRHLVVLNGSISLILTGAKTSTSFHISVLGELGVKESWTKLFIVGPLPCIVHHPIGAGMKGDIFFNKNGDELAWFDLRTQRIEELGIKGESWRCNVVVYKESLLPIGGINS